SRECERRRWRGSRIGGCWHSAEWTRSATRRSRRWASSVGQESRRLELERGADVDRLAIATIVLERRKTVTLDIVADSADQRDVARQRIRAAEVERHVVASMQSDDRVSGGAVGADCDSRRQAVTQRIAEAEIGGFAAAEGRIGALDLGEIAGDGEVPPADGDAEVVASRGERDGCRG